MLKCLGARALGGFSRLFARKFTQLNLRGCGSPRNPDELPNLANYVVFSRCRKLWDGRRRASLALGPLARLLVG